MVVVKGCWALDGRVGKREKNAGNANNVSNENNAGNEKIEGNAVGLGMPGMVLFFIK
jgi:hypothetical protein